MVRLNMPSMGRRVGALAAGLITGLATVASTVSAQPRTTPDADLAVSAWIQLVAPPGAELHDRRLTAALPGWQADAMGNLVRRIGTGSPRRVVACAMDIPGFVVSQITDNGYVRLHGTGVASHPLWSQFHETQQVRVLTARGEVTGVVAVANGHFSRQHRGDTAIVGVDNLWVDLGVNSRSEVAALGVSLLDPVSAIVPQVTYADFAAGPAAGARAGCAAVASAAAAVQQAGGPVSGETVFVLSSQRSLGWVGLAGVLARLGPVDRITLLDEGGATRGGTVAGAAARPARPAQAKPRALARVAPRDSVQIVTPRVRFAGSLVESVHRDEAATLLQAALRAAGSRDSMAPWVMPVVDTTTKRIARRDAYEPIERTFMALADLPGVPGHEWRVRDAIRAQLPAWAQRLATVDSAGNLIVAVGPDRDSVAYVAHMDEVSFEVAAIQGDGRVRLRLMGGPVVTAWEGKTALLHFDPEANGTVREMLRGVFVPRDSARTKPLPVVTAWFGVDSAALVARGVRVGSAVTGYKHATRLAATRLTARGSDDRTGSTALLLALQRINPATLTHKVVFVWSVREEGGLLGAGAFGAMHGRSLTRVYSIDTFVSSDTPLEGAMFAYAPLGQGFVLRSLDDGALTPRAERERVQRIAKAQGIPLQLGTTHGSTDGSSIAPYGAPNIGLSWPGRYSHAPGEVLDLRDVDALIRIIVATAVSK